MKTINVRLEDKTFKQVNKIRLYEGLTWEKYLEVAGEALKKIREIEHKHGK